MNKDDPRSGSNPEEDLPEDLKEFVKEMMDQLPPEALEQLRDLAGKAETEEDFVSFIMIGPCPKCGNELTKDGMSASGNEEDGDPTVGICPDCGHQWCAECGQPVAQDKPCPHWDAWDAHCKEQGIFQSADPTMEEGYLDVYTSWLDDYVEARENANPDA